VPEGAAVLGFLDPFASGDVVRQLADRKLSGLAFEAVPRITIAQSMDALSSQATCAGYAAVLLAAQYSPKFLPMLTTAAGTIAPAKVLVLGAGVAGLQAIATAKRLGAVVSAYDVRAEAAEQIASLGAKPITAEVQTDADAGGYAKELERMRRPSSWSCSPRTSSTPTS
jgi:H+-translocating NAD(P) transhydrogenase subunit alpha